MRLIQLLPALATGLALLLVGCAQPAMAAGAGANLSIQPGDRVVFLGDSITAGATYLVSTDIYYSLYCPGVDIAFVHNAGIPGDTAPGGFARLEKDVLAFHPTVVTICFGMNDGRYPPEPGKAVEDRLGSNAVNEDRSPR